MTRTGYFITVYNFEQLIELTKTPTGQQIIRITLAQWAGWSYQYNHLGEFFGFPPEEWKKNHDAVNIETGIYTLPNYTTSYDAVMPLVHDLKVFGDKNRYLNALSDQINLKGDLGLDSEFAMATVSPLQICIALIIVFQQSN